MAAAINAYITAVIFRVTVKATGEVFYAMPTGAPDGSCYEVRRTGKNKLTCTCPDCTYRKRDCKHILALRDHLNAKRSAAIIRQAEQVAAQASQPTAQPATKADAYRSPTKPAPDRRDTALPAHAGESTIDPLTGMYRPVAARAQADTYGDEPNYVPRDYVSHQYR